MLEREFRAIFAAAEQTDGWHGVPIPQEGRNRLVARAIEELGSAEQEIETDPEAIHDLLSILNRLVGDYIQAVMYHSQREPGTQGKKSGAGKKSTFSEWRRQLFEHRFSVVMFVIKNGPDTKCTRINWSEIATKWNKDHRAGRPQSARVLKRIYYRSLKEDGIMRQIEVLSAPDAMAKLTDPHDLKDWNDGNRHIRVMRIHHESVIVTDSTKRGQK